MHPFEKDISALRESIARVILGKNDVIDRVILCLLAQGHLLIEDVPGVGKTTLALTLAQSIDGTFQRIQFTSDLLPSDVLGVPIFNSENRHFEFRPGPIFANIVVADEINRTTPKTQSALLEAMQEGGVTVERETHPLPRPFMVIATQNPIEFHGTYPLPESQLDRFLMRIRVGYPEQAEELRILETKGSAQAAPRTEPVVNGSRILEMQRAAGEVRVDPAISNYMLALIARTRQTRDLDLGASPRGALALYHAVQVRAFTHGRTFATPDDVKDLAVPVLAHRLIPSGRRAPVMTQDSRSIVESILSEVIEGVEVPV